MDRASVHAACRYLNESLPYEHCGAMLLITVDGPDAAQVEREYEAVGELCLKSGAIEVYVADNPTTSQRVWKVRGNIPEAFAVISSHQGNEDLVVPIAAIPKLVAGMEALAVKYGVNIPAYGHAGDGNLHTRIVKDDDWPMDKWERVFPKVLKELYQLTAGLGGKISGEHGIGHKRKKYMPLVVDEAYLGMVRSIKRALDPNNVLNPGKIFDV
jgi:glycolate oxidase